MDVIVGTAGHIDHGKTALVKALTGTDADRLPEEKRRGITVDLGFAEMMVGEVHFGFVDVPGHERFVKNMLAGASGIDLVLLVVAADEGVMPQTREHFDICRLLDVKKGVVALTKSDLVDKDTFELAKVDTAELVAGSFLEDAPVIGVSAKTGDGLGELRAALVQAGASVTRKSERDALVTRMPIDRSFTMKGFGTVVTGTLASGELKDGSELALLPEGRRVRVRGLQTHGRSVASARAGQRVAVNLAGIDHNDVTRGMMLAEPDVLVPTQVIDAEVEVLGDARKPLRSRQRVRVHIGTVEALARLRILNEAGEIEQMKADLVQVRLETPVIAVPGERFIIRSYSPQHTIAGGRVIDALATRHRKKDLDSTRQYLTRLIEVLGDSQSTTQFRIAAAGDPGLTFTDLASQTGLRSDVLQNALENCLSSGIIVEAGGHFLAAANFDRLTKRAENAIADFHKREPLAKGASRETIRERALPNVPPEVFDAVLASLATAGKIVADKDAVRMASHTSSLTGEESGAVDKLRAAYRDAGLEVGKLDEVLASAIAGTRLAPQHARRLFQTLLDSQEIVKVTDEFFFSRGAIDQLVPRLKQAANASPDRSIDVAKFKGLAGVSRKYAIPLLEYFDRERVTQRVGDKRVIL